MIYISEEQDNYMSALDTIIHESVHAFQGLCSFICEDEPSAEMEAYTIAHIASTLIEEYTHFLGTKVAATLEIPSE